jgi:hypothetical protein
MRFLHIVAGLLGIASGAVALSAVKGGMRHRRSGLVFVYAMLVMSATGVAMAALQPARAVVIAGVLTAYLVVTALRTVRRPVLEFHWIDVLATVVALAIGLASFQFGFEALGVASATKDGHPSGTYFLFGAVALLAALGDAQTLLARRIGGARRVARHLWRMCFALVAGTLVAERATQNLLAIPALAVTSLMFYWLARVLLPIREALSPGATHAASETASRPAGTVANVAGSVALSPKSRPASVLVIANAAPTPSTIPSSAGAMPCRTTSSRRSLRRAPTADRIANSSARWLTE